MWCWLCSYTPTFPVTFVGLFRRHYRCKMFLLYCLIFITWCPPCDWNYVLVIMAKMLLKAFLQSFTFFFFLFSLKCHKLASHHNYVMCTWLHVDPPVGSPSVFFSPAWKKNKKLFSWSPIESTPRRWGSTHSIDIYTLTLSFLNSSYSGLSVGNSSRQSGQELVYEGKMRKTQKIFQVATQTSSYICKTYFPQPWEYTSWVEKVFARHFSNSLLFLKLQQTHRTLETFVCENRLNLLMSHLDIHTDVPRSLVMRRFPGETDQQFKSPCLSVIIISSPTFAGWSPNHWCFYVNI